MFATAKVINETKTEEESKISVAACDASRRGLISGIVRSVAMHLFTEFPDPKVQLAKIQTLVNAMRAGNDISADDQVWMVKSYFESLRPMSVSCDEDVPVPACSCSYLNWWLCVANLLDDVHVYEWTFNEESKKLLTEKEKNLVDTVRSATEAYYKARREFEDYFKKVNEASFKQLILKYGTTLSQIAPKWYESVKKCITPSEGEAASA